MSWFKCKQLSWNKKLSRSSSLNRDCPQRIKFYLLPLPVLKKKNLDFPSPSENVTSLMESHKKKINYFPLKNR